ncbi:MAG: integrin alpha, partial [Myxococcota bacterium]
MMHLHLVASLVGCKAKIPEPIVPDTIWYGQQTQDEAGRALDVGTVSGVGSVLVGTPSESRDPESRNGGAYLLDGSTAAGTLDDVASAVMLPATASQFGGDVAVLGDLTGDGIDDLGVTGVDEHEGPISSVHLYAGPVSGPVDAEQAWMQLAYAPTTETPDWLTACGDLNADGADDLCVGARGGVSGPTSQAAVYYGPIAQGELAFRDASVMLTADASECAGQAVDGEADLDGDGAPELVVGASCRNGYDGGLYVVSDPGTGTVPLADHPAWTGAPGTAGGAGQALAVGGDLDGDGLGDLFVGAPLFAERAGRGYLLTDPLAGGSLTAAAASFDAGEGDFTGFDAAIADLDGDGVADLAIGAPRDLYFAFDRPGQVAVFLGPLAPGPTAFDAADLRFTGSDAPDMFGMTLDAGDLDG